MPLSTIFPSVTKQAIEKWIARANEYEESGAGNYVEYIRMTKYSQVTLQNCGILGMPYQFNSGADIPRGMVDKETYGLNKYIGRIFEDKIAVNAPIVHFEIGKPMFMDKLTGAKRSEATAFVLDLLGNVDKLMGGEMTGSVWDEGQLKGKVNKMRYYGFKDDFKNYSNYVNAMARFTAIKMGLGSLKGPKGVPYKAFSILNYENLILASSNQVQNITYHIPIYCNVQSTNVSEVGNTSVTESALQSALSQGSKYAKEISFLLNTATNQQTITGNINNLMQAINDVTSGLTGGTTLTGLVKNIAAGGATIVSGANMMMPLIWEDTTFTKSYAVSIKLTTPYGDPEAVFNDIYVPLFCLLGMALPRQTSDYGYSSPFIIKCHSKGYFNCDMGIVESIDIKRGGNENQDWTTNQLPTNIDVTLNIKDLYPAIAVTQAQTASFAFAGNTGLVDYLNMMAGLNLAAVRPGDNIGAAMHMLHGEFLDPVEGIHAIAHPVYATFKQAINNFFS